MHWTSLRLPIFALIFCCAILASCGRSSEPAADDAGVTDTASNQAAPASEPALAIGSCHPNLPESASDEEAISNVLNGEGQFVVAQDIDSLMALWADESKIADAKNTPNDDADDQSWGGKDAIRHRYVRIVFPGAPSVAKPSNLDISISGDEATVMATTNIGDEVSPYGDEWRLVNNSGCWTIQSLTYNLEEK